MSATGDDPIRFGILPGLAGVDPRPGLRDADLQARGLGFESVLIPSAALAGYAILFFTLAVWRLSASEEK
jgi:hypothetical protein